jgi:cytoskeletal protein RodZ
VAQLSDRTKLSRQHIEFVEAERFADLPVAVYLRGIVMCIARELRLDGQKVARSYLERAAGNSRPGR